MLAGEQVYKDMSVEQVDDVVARLRSQAAVAVGNINQGTRWPISNQF